MDDKTLDWDLSRRALIRNLGLAGAVGLAGCTEGGQEDTTTATDTTTGGTDTTTTQADQVKMGGELISTFGADVKNFDPTKHNDTTSTKAFALVYETLMATDFDGKPQPHLAKSVEKKSDTEFTITLREGITFHNGDSLTAEDVKTSFERYKGTPRESDVYDWYDSSTVQGDYTIDVTLSRAYAPFKFSLGGVPIVPKAVVDGDLDLKENPVGTGPYVFDKHEPDSLFRLQRNEDYWFGGNDVMPEKPPIETVTFRIIVEQSAQLAALQGGDVDFINAPPAGSIKDLKNNDEFTVNERVAGGFDMFIYPTQVEPFTNRKVRQGVTRLIPREAIIDTVYDGNGIPAYAPISPLAAQFTSEEFQQEMKEKYAGYNKEKALSLLEEGFSEAGVEKPFKTQIVTNENPQRVKWSQLIKESLNSTDFFEVSVNQFEWNTYVGKVLAEDSHTKNQLVSLGWSAGWDPDAYVHNLFHSAQFTPKCCNINHYENETVDKLIDDALQTYDIEERKSIYDELQRTLVEESPMAFIQFDLAQDAFNSSTVKNFATYPIDGSETYGIYAPFADKFTYVDK